MKRRIKKTRDDLEAIARPLLWPVRVVALGYALVLFGGTVSYMGARVLIERSRDFLAAWLAAWLANQRSD